MRTSAFIAFLAVALALCGCASGTSQIEAALRQVSPVDALVVGGIAFIAAETDAGWSTSVAQRGERRFRISIIRWPGHGSGEGEFNLRFTHEAERLGVARACSGVRILSYAERYQWRGFAANRVGEGDVECL